MADLGDGLNSKPFDQARLRMTQVRENYRNTYFWRMVIARIIHSPWHACFYSDDGLDVREEDWDNLIVVDACREDLFSETVDTSRYDSYRSVRSLGSRTGEWISRNFSGRECPDTVYIAGTPAVSNMAPDSFHDIVEVWKTSFDENHGTVLAEDMVEAVRQARKDYPHKRYVVHFMQPHYPFVQDEELNFNTVKHHENRFRASFKRPRPINVWDALEMGEVTRNEVWAGYKRNLEYVIGHIDNMLTFLDGKSVITSDHGNLLGERVPPLPIKQYAHPGGLKVRELIEVPWAVIGGERRLISAEGVSEAKKDELEIRERLKDLGYF